MHKSLRARDKDADDQTAKFSCLQTDEKAAQALCKRVSVVIGRPPLRVSTTAAEGSFFLVSLPSYTYVTPLELELLAAGACVHGPLTNSSSFQIY